MMRWEVAAMDEDKKPESILAYQLDVDDYKDPFWTTPHGIEVGDKAAGSIFGRDFWRKTKVIRCVGNVGRGYRRRIKR